MATYTISYTARPGVTPLSINVLTGVVLNGFTGAVTTLEAELVARVAGYVPGSYNPATDIFHFTGTGFVDTIVLGNGGGSGIGNIGEDILTGGSGVDVLYGGADADTITLGTGTSGTQIAQGGDGNDTITAGAGSAQISGENGDDIIDVSAAGLNTSASMLLYGGSGNDTITGSAGIDTIDGGLDNDIIYAGDGGDNIGGAGGTDTIYAGDGADTINGGMGTDTIDAGGGNDTITSSDGQGPDIIDGGADTDTLTMNRTSAVVAFVADFSNAAILQSLADGSSVVNVEGITFTGGTLGDTITASNSATLTNTVNGGGGNDILTGGSNNHTLNGDAGDDTLTGGSGFESLYGGTENDTIALGGNSSVSFNQFAGGGAGNDTITAGAGYTQINGDAGDDSIDVSAAGVNTGRSTTLSGGTGDDTITGSDGTDSIDGGADNDSIMAGGGADTINGSTGTDTIDAGAGNDTITSSDGQGPDIIDGGADTDTLTMNRTSVVVALVADFSNAAILQSLADGSSVINVEGITFTGGTLGDTITASNSATLTNTVNGGGGNDILTGGSNNHTLNGDAGEDTLTGGSGFETLNGGTENDTIALGGNSSASFFQFGNGGDGADTITAGVGNTQISGGNGADIIDVSAAGLNAGRSTSLSGNAGDDTITGSDGTDSIDGGADNDSIMAGGGADTINGSTGTDTIDAGAGNDTITSSDGQGPDIIDGGADTDTLTMNRTSVVVALVADFSNAAILQSLADGSSVINVEGITFTGGTLGDTITASNSATLTNTVNGGGGNDILTGGSNNHTLNGDAGEDTLTGGSGFETLNGGTENDTIALGGNSSASFFQFGNGGDGADTITAGVGNTQISGGNGADIIDVSAAGLNAGRSTSLSGNAGDDTITGSDGTDSIDGGADNDSIMAGGGADTINGSTGTDTIDAGAGNDTITSSDGQGPDIIDGGADTDTLTMNRTGAVVAFVADFSNAAILQSLADGSSVVNVEGITFTGGTLGDTITASNSATLTNTVNGGGGNDILTGGSNNHTLNGDAGDDTLTGGSGFETLNGGTENDTIALGGNSSASFFQFGNGGDGADTITAGVGNTQISGGNGADIIDVSAAGLNAGRSTSLSGNAGDDTITGSDGTDTISGGTDNDSISAGDGNDSITGDAGNDSLDGGGGNDTINGGTETDTASYASAASAVTVSLALTVQQNTVGAGLDTLSNFENLTGSAFNDTLSGNASANTVTGGDGNDSLAGGAGNDALIGGIGTDTANYAAASNTAGITISLLAGTGLDAYVIGEIDTLSQIENVVGSFYNDTITGDGADNVLEGGQGVDVIFGGDGNDTITDAGSIVNALTNASFELPSNGGNSVVQYNTGSVAITGWTVGGVGVNAGVDILGTGWQAVDGTQSLDVNALLPGSVTQNIATLIGTQYEITFWLAGNPQGGAGTHIHDLQVAAGSTTQNYVFDSTGRTITNLGYVQQSMLFTATAATTAISFTSFDLATVFGPIIDAVTVSVLGLGNTLNGGNGNDTIIANAGNDILNGDAGNDTLTGGAGLDTMDGGADSDTANYAGVSNNLTVVLNGATDAIVTVAGGDNDTIRNIENFTGGSGADSITGDGLANILTGNGGADTFEGGIGADSTYGGAGNDIFRFTAGDLIATEIIDGGADTDLVELRSGAHSLVGVTLTNIEQIALIGAAATTVTLGSADQALLFTSSGSLDDTVIFSGDFTPAELDALALAGIEHVQFVSNGNAITANYISGVLREIIIEDIPVNNDVWETVVHTRDALGVLTSLHTVFDTGIDEVISFDGGLKTTVVKTDLPGGPEYTWDTQEFTYDPTGTFLASMLQTEDNGDTRDHTYTGGALTRYEFTDVSGSSPVDTFSIDYTIAGVIINSTTNFDNGVLAATMYTAGVRSSYLQTDVDNVNASYATFLQNFAANGIDVTDQIYTHDNGNTTATNFVAGGQMTDTAANNTMTGAVGADTFVFAPPGSGGGGNDYIANFEDGTDVIDLTAYGFADFAAVQTLAVANGPNGVYITFSGSNHLAVNGLSLANMTPDDFVLL